MAIRSCLSEWLRETNTSQRELAAAIGVSKDTINAIAQNKTQRPDLTIVEKLCKYFNMRVEDFFYQFDDE